MLGMFEWVESAIKKGFAGQGLLSVLDNYNFVIILTNTYLCNCYHHTFSTIQLKFSEWRKFC